jgi:hypothetical protein
MQTLEKKSKSVKSIIAWMFLSGVAAVALNFILVKPSWLAHFIASSFCFCFGTLILFFYGFHPRSNFVGHKTKLARQSERTQRNAQRVIRSLVIGFACYLFYFVAIPILSDWAHFFQQGRPYVIHFKGRVANNDILFGAFFINQTLHITKEDESSGQAYFALFFPRVARYNNSYWFLVAPKSGLVLDWQPANELEDAPTWK